MTLYELGLEYEKRALAVTERIHKLNKELKNLSGEDKVYMRRRIYLLYVDATYCRETAKKLKEYYERKNPDGQNNI